MAESKFNSWDELFMFVDDLADKLQSQGLREPAHRLSRWSSDARGGVWPVASELRRELGVTIRKIQQSTVEDVQLQSELECLGRQSRQPWS